MYWSAWSALCSCWSSLSMYCYWSIWLTLCSYWSDLWWWLINVLLTLIDDSSMYDGHWKYPIETSFGVKIEILMFLWETFFDPGTVLLWPWRGLLVPIRPSFRTKIEILVFLWEMFFWPLLMTHRCIVVIEHIPWRFWWVWKMMFFWPLTLKQTNIQTHLIFFIWPSLQSREYYVPAILDNQLGLFHVNGDQILIDLSEGDQHGDSSARGKSKIFDR